MRFRRRLGPRAVIELLVLRAPGDAMVFQPGEFALRIPAEEWPQVTKREIMADVAVKIPVSGVARVAFLLTPDLPA